MGRLIPVNNSLRNKPVQICLGLRIKSLCNGSVFGLQDFLDHGSHPATMFTVAKAACCTLAYPLNCRSVLGHDCNEK